MFERLVVAYDGSKPAGAVAELAFELARRRGARLTLASVLELADPYREVPQVAPGIERAEEDWRGRLAALAAGAPDGASVETEVLVANKAGPALLELLRERRAEVLVGGRASRHRSRRWPWTCVRVGHRMSSSRCATSVAPVLAVVGSRGLHGFKGLLLGSTARHLVNNAPCPVLIVRIAPNEEAR
jgi:nucleotide-binding universal stress UspA family protein